LRESHQSGPHRASPWRAAPWSEEDRRLWSAEAKSKAKGIAKAGARDIVEEEQVQGAFARMARARQTKSKSEGKNFLCQKGAL
jgi:hypothetical protein